MHFCDFEDNCGRDTHCWRLDWVRTDRHTYRHTKVKTVYLPVSLRSLTYIHIYIHTCMSVHLADIIKVDD